MRSDLEDLIRQLVSIDSVNPALGPSHPGEREIARFVADWATNRGLGVTMLEQTAGRPSVVVTAHGSGGGKSLLLNAHLDTVGVAGMEAPFDAQVRGGYMYGRGVMDMKASLAACLLTAAAARERGLKGDVILTAVADEEHGSIGTEETLAHLTKERINVHAAIVTEPTGLDLHVAHRGFAVVEVLVAGRASHTSQPEAGVNAVAHLGRILAAADRLDGELRQRPAHPLLSHGHLIPVLVSGGTELFTTPASAKVMLERRTLPGETTEGVVAEIEGLIDDLAAEDPSFHAETKTLVAREPFEAPASHPIADLLAQAITAERGTPPRLLGAPYWTDAALVAAAGIPTVLFGPTGGGIHQPGEWLDLESAHVVQRVLEKVTAEFCA